MSPWTDHLLWEAPGLGTVGKTGSREVSTPQGRPTAHRPEFRRTRFFGERDADSRSDLFLKQPALVAGSQEFIPTFIHSLIHSSNTSGRGTSSVTGSAVLGWSGEGVRPERVLTLFKS